jgi:hypothetical protein
VADEPRAPGDVGAAIGPPSQPEQQPLGDRSIARRRRRGRGACRGYRRRVPVSGRSPSASAANIVAGSACDASPDVRAATSP